MPLFRFSCVSHTLYLNFRQLAVQGLVLLLEFLDFGLKLADDGCALF